MTRRELINLLLEGTGFSIAKNALSDEKFEKDIYSPAGEPIKGIKQGEDENWYLVDYP